MLIQTHVRCVLNRCYSKHTMGERESKREAFALSSHCAVVVVVVAGYICSLARWLDEWKIPEQMSHANQQTENNAIIFAMCWHGIVEYKKNWANERTNGSKNESLFNVSHTIFCLSISGALNRVHKNFFRFSSIVDMNSGKYCFFYLCNTVKYRWTQMNSLVLSQYAIAMPRYFIYMREKIKNYIFFWFVDCWNRFFGCWVFYSWFDSAFTMSFDVLLYIHRVVCVGRV